VHLEAYAACLLRLHQPFGEWLDEMPLWSDLAFSLCQPQEVGWVDFHSLAHVKMGHLKDGRGR